MQIHEESLAGAERPCAPLDCARCKGRQRLHGKGGYERNAACTGNGKVFTRRYECPRCGRTFGIIPRGMLPYRSLPVRTLEQWMDQIHGVAAFGFRPAGSAAVSPSAGEDARPPPASEVEGGCLLRTSKILLQRIPILCGVLGQQLSAPVHLHGDLGRFWRALRQLGRLGKTVVELAAKFNTSLLADYRSLQPNWLREEAPV